MTPLAFGEDVNFREESSWYGVGGWEGMEARAGELTSISPLEREKAGPLPGAWGGAKSSNSGWWEWQDMPPLWAGPRKDGVWLLGDLNINTGGSCGPCPWPLEGDRATWLQMEPLDCKSASCEHSRVEVLPYFLGSRDTLDSCIAPERSTLKTTEIKCLTSWCPVGAQSLN